VQNKIGNSESAIVVQNKIGNYELAIVVRNRILSFLVGDCCAN
jgi:methylthioribose-1-phosphate isomerase